MDFFPDANDVLEIWDTERPSPVRAGEATKAARLAGGAWPSASGGPLVVRQSPKPAAGHEFVSSAAEPASLVGWGGCRRPPGVRGRRVDSLLWIESMAWLPQVSLAGCFGMRSSADDPHVMPCVLPASR